LDVFASSWLFNTHFQPWFPKPAKKIHRAMKPFFSLVVLLSKFTLTSHIQPTGDYKMTFFKMAAAAALLTLVPMSAMAAEMPTAEQCDAWFTKADSNKDGALGQQEEASKYAGMISKSSVADNNSGTAADALILQKDIFLAECAKGTFGVPQM
jgi:hypothetical protein